MTQDFTLGPRYDSEDMYRDMGLGPDSLVSVDNIGGVLYTDYVKNLTPSTPIRLSRWQRFMRRLTPKRFRKPPATRLVDPIQRALALNADLKRIVDGLTK